jgi:hypothetical protein
VTELVAGGEAMARARLAAALDELHAVVDEELRIAERKAEAREKVRRALVVLGAVWLIEDVAPSDRDRALLASLYWGEPLVVVEWLASAWNVKGGAGAVHSLIPSGGEFEWRCVDCGRMEIRSFPNRTSRQYRRPRYTLPIGSGARRRARNRGAEHARRMATERQRRAEAFDARLGRVMAELEVGLTDEERWEMSHRLVRDLPWD